MNGLSCAHPGAPQVYLPCTNHRVRKMIQIPPAADRQLPLPT